VKLIPAEVMVDARVKASLQTEKPVNWVIGALTLLVWGLAIFFVGRAITLWILKRD
jgi:hypothetical protein